MFDFLGKKPAAPLFLYNTLSRKKEEFVPISKGTVRMYTCGPTVYDYATIGNLRSYVFSDILKRVLLLNDYRVNQTMNLTDFGHLTSDADEGEDKMIKALRREGKELTLENMAAVAAQYAEQFKSDTAALNILPPSQYTPASAYVKEQVALIKTLFDKGFVYETSDGVYFEIQKFPTYGQLGNIDLEKLREGARVAVNTEKKHPADFAVWKKGALGWESDWGKGFPGWHIECTAMVLATLGEQIDIHTGGIDHIPIHHNAEIAQAEAATGKSPYVKYWLHNAFITIDEKRIGKSEGNAITLRELEERDFSPLAYRYWLLNAHYRSPVNFTYEGLGGAGEALRRLQAYALEHFDEKGTVVAHYEKDFRDALNDDLGTPQALAIMWELLKDGAVASGDRTETLRLFDSVLGLSLFDDKEVLESALGAVDTDTLPREVKDLVEKRREAREKKDFKTGDRIRNELKELGYTVLDTETGQQLRKE